MLRSLAALPIRFMLCAGFLYHGLPLFSGRGHQEFLGTLKNLGVPAPAVASYLVPVIEVGGAIAFLLGAFVVVFGALNIVNMLVAMVKVHLPNGFNFVHITGMTDKGPTFGMPGYEVNLLYITLLVSLMLSGAGALSIDAMRKHG